MHFLLTAIGSYGDVFPMLGLAETLAGRGHEVSVAANPHFAGDVRGLDVDFVPLGTAEDYEQFTAQRDLWHARRGLTIVFRDGIVRRMREAYASLDSACREGETVVVSHMLDVGGRLLRETRQVPVAAAVFAPASLWSLHRTPKLPGAMVGPKTPRWLNQFQLVLGDLAIGRPIIRKPLNQFRQELGLPPVKGRVLPDWWFRVDVTLGLFPDWFAEPQPDWPQPFAATGFPLWAGGTCAPLSEPLKRFLDDGRPPIVWTAGTANRHAAKFFATAIEACQRLNERGVLLTKYPEQLPGKLPPSIRHDTFVPLAKLLPRAAAFVHHGGIGSTAHGLAAAVPQLVVTLGFDQPDNADRLMELGVAETIPATRFNTNRATAALKRVLRNEVRERARELAHRCNGPASRDAACERLEELAAK